MNIGKRLTLLLAAWVLFCSTALADKTSLFDIHSRPAGDLLPQVRMLLGEKGSATAYGNRLIVRAPEKQLEDVRWLISELDRAPRNLLVEVRVDRGKSNQDTGATVRMHDLQANVRLRQYRTHGDEDTVQRVRTIDGRAARIQIGQSIPIYQVERSREGNTISETVGVTYKDIHTGIYVLPRSHADRVTVEIYQQAESPAVATGHFETQHADTVVSGRLGEWIPFGSINTRGNSHSSGLGYRAGTEMATQRNLSVRVTLIE